MRNFGKGLPPGLRHLTIFADRCDDGESAAADLYRRVIDAGIEATIWLPNSDDDFAKDLKLGHGREQYEPEEPPLFHLACSTGDSSERIRFSSISASWAASALKP